jgi:CDP-diacylglycerol pyrophosphatase
VRYGVVVLVVWLVAVGSAGTVRADGDPGALWRIVDGQCVPNQVAHGDPAPCASVQLNPAGAAGPQGRSGWAVLKDLVGATQFLLIPTQRTSGIEDPAILAPDAPNYFAAAWKARSFVDERARSRLPRDQLSLAINSTFARSQNQLHIHVDCVRPDVHAALTEYGAAVGTGWAPFPAPLAGHRYDAIRIADVDLDQVNPFVLLADGVAGARDDMAARTLLVVGSVDPDGGPGFVVLTDRADAATGDLAEGEQLQDHDICRA